jgi:hypothetical protein
MFCCLRWRTRLGEYGLGERLLQKRKSPLISEWAFQGKSLTMSYFHTGIRTIIGAKSFHCPVRDGKEWGQLAMVIRHNLSSC